MSSAASGTESLEQQLLHLLRFSGIEKDHLRELVSIVVGLKSNGLGAFRIFPRGIGRVDGLTVQTTVPAPDITNLLINIFGINHPTRIGGVVIFPYGILAVDSYQVNLSLGNTGE
jgi:hypothetical protein